MAIRRLRRRTFVNNMYPARRAGDSHWAVGWTSAYSMGF